MDTAKEESKAIQIETIKKFKGKHVNNEALQLLAESVVKLKVIENMTEAEIKAGERLGSFMELLLCEFPTYADGVKRQHLKIEDLIKSLPPELWDSLSKNKKSQFEYYCAATAVGINKSLLQIEKVLKEMAGVLSGLSEHKEALKNEYQDEAIRAIYEK